MSESASRIIRCPSCGRSTRYDASNSFRPFCSARCKTQDIAQWAEESYRIPTKPGMSEDDWGDDRPEDNDSEKF